MSGRTPIVRRLRAGSGPLGEIAVVLVLKLILIFALSQLFFASSRHPQPTPDDVAVHLLAPRQN